MKKILSWAVMAAFLGCNIQADGQAADESPEQRKARILENLKYRIPQIRDVSVVMGELTDSETDGLDQGSFTVNGQQTYQFLITTDDTTLYLLAADPIDVSLSADEIAVAMEGERQAASQEALDRHTELAVFAAGMPVRGNPDAPVTIIEFSDFQCPFCARGFVTIEQVLEKYPEDVKFVYLHFPLGNHSWAMPAAIAAVCAARQDAEAFWTLHDNYLRKQRAIDTNNILDKSRELLAVSGIDLDAWAACAGDKESEAYQEAALAVESSMATGSKFGVTGTPGFFINGHFLSGAQPLEEFDALIVQAKANAAR